MVAKKAGALEGWAALVVPADLRFSTQGLGGSGGLHPLGSCTIGLSTLSIASCVFFMPFASHQDMLDSPQATVVIHFKRQTREKTDQSPHPSNLPFPEIPTNLRIQKHAAHPREFNTASPFQTK
jgi:hypothetical protein